MHRIGCCFHGGIKLRSVFRIASLFLLTGLPVTAGFARLVNTSQAAQEVQVDRDDRKEVRVQPVAPPRKTRRQNSTKDHGPRQDARIQDQSQP